VFLWRDDIKYQAIGAGHSVGDWLWLRRCKGFSQGGAQVLVVAEMVVGAQRIKRLLE